MDLSVSPSDVGGQAFIDVAFVDQQKYVPLLCSQSAISVSRLCLTEHLRRACSAHAPDFVLEGGEGPTLVPIGLNFVSNFLSRFTKLSMAGYLRFGALDR